jgi:hypothetical protein
VVIPVSSRASLPREAGRVGWVPATGSLSLSESLSLCRRQGKFSAAPPRPGAALGEVLLRLEVERALGLVREAGDRGAIPLPVRVCAIARPLLSNGAPQPGRTSALPKRTPARPQRVAPAQLRVAFGLPVRRYPSLVAANISKAVLGRYLDGESVTSLAKEVGISRQALQKRIASSQVQARLLALEDKRDAAAAAAEPTPAGTPAPRSSAPAPIEPIAIDDVPYIEHSVVRSAPRWPGGVGDFSVQSAGHRGERMRVGWSRDRDMTDSLAIVARQHEGRVRLVKGASTVLVDPASTDEWRSRGWR